MIEGIPRISVLVITYNQEDVIKRAIDSLLAQKDYIYEICVSDDCSKDGTWDILQDYSVQHPGLFVLNRNEPNVGIFENIERTWSMPTGDVIYQLAGDDECGKEWFIWVTKLLSSLSLDYSTDSFAVYGNYKLEYPNGDSLVFSNNLCEEEGKQVFYSLLGMMGNRSCCFSKTVLKKFQRVSQGRSHIAETAQDIQIPLFAGKFYYIPEIGNIYYAGTGISVKINEETALEREQIVPYAFEFLTRNGYTISNRETTYCKYNVAVKRMQRDSSSKLGVFYWFIRTYSFSFTVIKKSFLRTLFSLIHKMPHRRSMVFYI